MVESDLFVFANNGQIVRKNPNDDD